MTVHQLISTLSAIVISSFSLVAWAYAEFETKTTSKERYDRIELRLDRIENKIDRLIERERH